jgi:hypothetical protein
MFELLDVREVTPTCQIALFSQELSILIQENLQTGGKMCPLSRELQEIKTCPTTIECAVYVWQSDPWGMCVSRENGVPCGPGKRKRDVGCYSLLGQMVNDIR